MVFGEIVWDIQMAKLPHQQYDWRARLLVNATSYQAGNIIEWNLLFNLVTELILGNFSGVRRCGAMFAIVNESKEVSTKETSFKRECHLVARECGGKHYFR